MGSVNLVVIVESIRNLITKQDRATFHLPSILTVSAALGVYFKYCKHRSHLHKCIAVKFALFLYCYSLRKKSSQVLLLWQDHRNDLFINSFGKLHPRRGLANSYLPCK